MDSMQEYPITASLFTALASSVVAPAPISSPTTSVWPSPLPTFASESGHNHGGEGSGHYEWSSLIGIITALTGNVLISLALNIQRYAHIRINKEWEHEKLQQDLDWKRTHRRGDSGGSYGAFEASEQSNGVRDEDDSTARSGRFRDDISDQERQIQGSPLSDRTVRAQNGSPQGRRKSYLRSPYWWAGIILMTLGETGNFMAYGFAPASIVSPLGVVALISNCVIAPFMLKEQFRKRDLWGVLVAVAGAVVVVLSAKSSEEKIGPHDIWVMITRWEFETYLGITAALIVVLMWASRKYGSRTILIDVGLVGLFGGYTALSTKGVSSLLSFTLWHVITFPITYLLAFVLVFSALMQIRYINKALQRFDSTQVIPTQFVLFTLSVIIGSAVLYRDFESYTPARAGKFVGGCLLTFLGVYFITSGRVRADDESTYSTDEEEAIGLLPGERYQDRLDLSPPQRAQTKNRPRPRTPDLLDGALQSPSGSLLSRGLDDLDDNQSTPRAVLSAESPSAGSVGADSLSEPSPGSSSSSRPLSYLRNPWAETLEQDIKTVASEPVDRPITPPEQPSHKAASSTVLLRFPSAPDMDTDGSGALDGTRANARINTVPQTPPRKARDSISARFSPGPLFSTLSGGFSAVVADSIRRGEMSPAKERRVARRGGRKKHPSTSILDGILRDPASQGEEFNQDPDSTLWDGTEPRVSTATAPADPIDGLTTAPVSAAHSTPGVESGEIPRNHSDDITTLSRLRSLSDSWSKTVPWLGGVLQKHKESQKEPNECHPDEGSPNQEDHPGPVGPNA
ncbi:magnesium transporter NIPA-domain-containing protein [Aspergillus cavernicola]|uniref:Magnesium transporter NIPA-domain-containing protein n=1 Tax=Aspergillus cavernicola TaxID=176166 RepID=A0ABR4I0N8_9EURO